MGTRSVYEGPAAPIIGMAWTIALAPARSAPVNWSNYDASPGYWVATTIQEPWSVGTLVASWSDGTRTRDSIDPVRVLRSVSQSRAGSYFDWDQHASGEQLMNDTLKIANHLSSGEVKLRMRMSGGFLRLQKWLVVYNAIVDPRPVSEIARHTGLSEGMVRRVIDEYNSLGPDSFDDRAETGEPPRGVVGRIRSLFVCSA